MKEGRPTYTNPVISFLLDMADELEKVPTRANKRWAYQCRTYATIAVNANVDPHKYEPKLEKEKRRNANANSISSTAAAR